MDEIERIINQALPKKSVVEVQSASDVSRVAHYLNDMPNKIISANYGAQVIVRSGAEGISNTMTWNKQEPRGEQTIALLQYKARGSGKKALESIVDQNETDAASKLAAEALLVVARLQSNYVAYFDYDTLILFRFGDNPSTSMECTGLKECRSALLVWLNDAMQDAGLKAVADAPFQFHPHGSPAKIFFQVNITKRPAPVDTKLEPSSSTKIHEISPQPLPNLPAAQLQTVDGIIQASQQHLLKAVNIAAKINYGDQVHQSCDIIPNAAVWYIEPAPSQRKILACMLYKPRGTIQPSEWETGLVMRQQMLQQKIHGARITGTAVAQSSEMQDIWKTHGCYGVAMFDWDNLVVSHFTENQPTLAAVILQDSFRTALFIFVRRYSRLAGLVERD